MSEPQSPAETAETAEVPVVPEEAEVVLRADGVTAGYGGPPIIEDVSLQVQAGRITAIVGPNGAGKSTLLKALMGTLRVTRGEVRVRGEVTTNMAPEKLVRRGLSYVPQVANIFPDLTVRENMEMGGFSRRRGISNRIGELCELFPDLGQSLRRRAATLSGGQRSMLAMARALMLEPAVMLLDEPSAGLSPLLQGALWEQIEKIAGTGVGICVVEQNTRRTLRHAHWGYILVLGRNRLDGPAQQLLHDESVVELYVGRMN
jgi:ABC-type branched-subunit amino acid transport system ATPase component